MGQQSKNVGSREESEVHLSGRFHRIFTIAFFLCLALLEALTLRGTHQPLFIPTLPKITHHYMLKHKKKETSDSSLDPKYSFLQCLLFT